MILPSSQMSSVIKPSQPKMAAVGDPHCGEIPMELYAKPSDVFLYRRVSRINSDNRITLNLRLSKRLILIDGRGIFFCRQNNDKGVLNYVRFYYWFIYRLFYRCSNNVLDENCIVYRK